MPTPPKATINVRDLVALLQSTRCVCGEPKREGDERCDVCCEGAKVSSVGKWKLESLVKDGESLLAYFNQLEAEIAALKRPWGVFAEYEPVPLDSMQCDVAVDSKWTAYEREYSSSREVVARNVEKGKQNAALLNRLVETIKAVGVKTHFKKWHRNKLKDFAADWYESLLAATPRQTISVEEYDRKFQDRKRYRDEHLKKRAEGERLAKLADEREQAEKRRQVRVLELALLLGLDAVEATIDDVREAILSRDKYLMLAAAGQETRSDWSDGCWRVQDALRKFTVESSSDAEIVSEWEELCSDFDDGRCFRDCEWNYDKVRELASPEAVEFWNRLHKDA